ncbi:hypothetical protein JTE90_010782 [Oedothorax gibbosus]|uniref:Uncharacterized protein n=1 Tax=Oedothorax gibbosus TaxID=931172 RepID=A0AAV6TCT1_9ARAC|nr:hypothetical protein JTE90_010782 [Oedothorax gibbosus]
MVVIFTPPARSPGPSSGNPFSLGSMLFSGWGPKTQVCLTPIGGSPKERTAPGANERDTPTYMEGPKNPKGNPKSIIELQKNFPNQTQNKNFFCNREKKGP